jgi:hypothetical protein
VAATEAAVSRAEDTITDMAYFPARDGKPGMIMGISIPQGRGSPGVGTELL